MNTPMNTSPKLTSLAMAVVALLISFSGWSQSDPATPWHLSAYEVDGIPGIALPQALALLNDRHPQTTVKVAILDGGIDYDHDALASSIYTNALEIPGNGIDDDGNGYADDVHGWNFVVDSLGENIHMARYEAVYIKHLHDSLTRSKLPMPQWLEDIDMELVEDEFRNIKEYGDDCWFWTSIYLEYAMPFTDVMGDYPDNFEEIWFHRKSIELDRGQRKFLKSLMEDGIALDDLTYYLEQNWNMDEYWMNPHFNPRATDEPETGYGNPLADEKYDDHGTHVAGIIGADRLPGSESYGIAAGLVELIPIRMVVSGDELDKDVANAIRYAVDAGADIIAYDATDRPRPETTAAILGAIHAAGKLAMADCSCLADGQRAQAEGAEILGTTLSGYTAETAGRAEGVDCDLIRAFKALGAFVMAEGRVNTPELAAQAMAAGTDAVTVGTALTRLEHVTGWFQSAVAHAVRAR